MCGDTHGSPVRSAAQALELVNAGLDYLNGPDAGALAGAACGQALVSVSVLRAKLTAAHAGLLRRFDAAGAHDADGYPTAASWLAAKTRSTVRDARAGVRRMRELGRHPGIEEALAAGHISVSLSREMADWTGKLPQEMRGQTERLLLDTAGAGAGANTHVMVHVPLSALRAMPGASELEAAWIAARLGEPGYLTGTDARTAACDALIIPVVTGHADMGVIDQIIDLALTAARWHRHPGDDTSDSAAPKPLSPRAWAALRYAIARLAADFVSGPNGLASALRTGLLEPPFTTPSLPLDIGYSDSVPAHIRRAVTLRDRHCAWPGGCDRPASASDVHHLVHKKDGGPASVASCALYCQFHHDVCIHRWGWQVILHPDGTSEARSPDGRQILRSHAPPSAPRAPAA